MAGVPTAQTLPAVPASQHQHIQPQQTEGAAGAGAVAAAPLAQIPPPPPAAATASGVEPPGLTPASRKLVRLISEYGLKIRLLNVRFDDAAVYDAALVADAPAVPSRDGLDDDFYYDVDVFGG